MRRLFFVGIFFGLSAQAGVGDPQIKTDHQWYPGELAISNFERLFATQATLYEQVTGKKVESDHDKALASWLWRNTHYWHGECGGRDLWGEGLGKGKDRRLREYWTGLFGYGFGLCGTTHSQWTAELDALLGHCRSRGVGVAGHNSFEVFLKGGAYGSEGKWALLDHDLSTVIFDKKGGRLLSISEIQGQVDQWTDRNFMPEKQNGWLVSGLHPSDGQSFKKYAVSEYLAGYAGPPPMVNLRRGERMRRYFEPGLEDGKTFVFWGKNMNQGGIPGPARSRTWVNQPEKMYGSTNGTPHVDGQARYANVETVFRPTDSNGGWEEGLEMSREGEMAIYEFQTPYIIAATPPDLSSAWGIYEEGCRNGLVVSGEALGVSVRVSTDRKSYSEHRILDGDLIDFTDEVKGRAFYWLIFTGDLDSLKNSKLEIRTVCQANVAVFPRLKDGGTQIDYAASNQRTVSIGPELDSVLFPDSKMGEKAFTLKTEIPDTVGVYASAHVASSNPPSPSVSYQIAATTDSGNKIPIIKDWRIQPRGDEPGDFWSQSFCYGSTVFDEPQKIDQIDFSNDGGKRYLRAEAHFVTETESADPLRVTYHWSDDAGKHQTSHIFESDAGTWDLATGTGVKTYWVQFEPVP